MAGMRKAIIEGSPIVHSKLDFPSLAELIKLQSFQAMDLEEARAHGNSVIRYLIDNTPVKNDKKYAVAWLMVVHLKKGTGTIKYKHEWHVDGSGCPFDGSDRYFIAMNECTATTEFSKYRIEHEVKADITHLEYDKYIDSNASEIGIVGQRVPCNSFIEFTSNHAHRSTDPLRDEFRVLFRVCESDHLKPIPLEKALLPYTNVFHAYGEGRKSIEQIGNGAIKIYF